MKPKQPSKALLHWVKDYKKCTKYGNKELASEIIGRISYMASIEGCQDTIGSYL